MNTSHLTPRGDSAGVLYRGEGLTLYLGDPVIVLRELRSSSVDCVVTSPPSWWARKDTTTGWSGGRTRCPHLIGIPTPRAVAVQHCARCGATQPDSHHKLTATPHEYIETLQQIFAQLHRVLVPTGTVWIHLGDGYATHSSLLGMPWRIALTLQADGWILRNAIVWHQPPTTPDPAHNRLACRYELIFLLVRQPHYFFDLDPIRQHYSGDRPLSRRAHRRSTKPHTATGTWPPPGTPQTHLRGRNPGDVWTIPTHPTPAARLPLELLTRCIAAGCPPFGTVLDPFSGIGTTGLAARRLGCGYIGINTNADDHTTTMHRLGLICADDDSAHPGEEEP